jgi:hypothetical protein
MTSQRVDSWSDVVWSTMGKSGTVGVALLHTSGRVVVPAGMDIGSYFTVSEAHHIVGDSHESTKGSFSPVQFSSLHFTSRHRFTGPPPP